MKSGYLKKDQQAKILQSLNDVSKLEMFITDEAHSVESLASWGRRMKMKNDIGILWIDYLQNIQTDSKTRTRNDEVTNMMIKLGALRKQLGIPIVVVSQLSRSLETAQKPRRPKLSDLRDSGGIEEKADIVIFLSHSKDNDLFTLVDVAKQRNGPTGEMMLKKVFQYMRFEEPEEDVDDFKDRQTEFEND